MIRITQIRSSCIGCNACVEAADYRWRVSKKDGKCTLIGSTEKRGFHTILVHNNELDDSLQAAQNCPVRIIQVQAL